MTSESNYKATIVWSISRCKNNYTKICHYGVLVDPGFAPKKQRIQDMENGNELTEDGNPISHYHIT